MSKITLLGLQNRVDTLSQKTGLRREDRAELEDLKLVCLGIAEDCDRPCSDRKRAAEIAVSIIELNIGAIVAKSRGIVQKRTEQGAPLVVKYHGRTLGQTAN